MNIKLIAVDLDGTLLNDKQEVSTKTKEALQRASKMGIKIVPCSGRPFPGIKEYLDELDEVEEKENAKLKIEIERLKKGYTEEDAAIAKLSNQNTK